MNHCPLSFAMQAEACFAADLLAIWARLQRKLPLHVGHRCEGVGGGVSAGMPSTSSWWNQRLTTSAPVCRSDLAWHECLHFPLHLYNRLLPTVQLQPSGAAIAAKLGMLRDSGVLRSLAATVGGHGGEDDL